MVKRTLFFGNPVHLSTRHEQLSIRFKDEEKEEVTAPIEDLGYIVLEDPQITITNRLLTKLTAHKVVVITCDQKHMPTALLQPMVGHSEQTERMRYQLNATLPLKKNLWQQCVRAKIKNQGEHLSRIGKAAQRMIYLADTVKTGDSTNNEAVAAAYYFQHLFDLENFTRHQHGDPPNNLLNYGYAVLRAMTARALVSSGLLPSVGIFHHNKYNAFCLADDLMEPYRPFVDTLVHDIVTSGEEYDELSKALKATLLSIPAMDVLIEGRRSPMMVAMSRTTSSLYECFAGVSRKILFPDYVYTS